MMDRRNAGAYRARVYLLSGVASPELKAVAGEFSISTTSVSKMHEEIERMGEIDLRLQTMLRSTKSGNDPILLFARNFRMAI
ncbi:MAG: hypothetical protein WBD99_00125 [Thermodesulfobacteriota bacterium]